MTLTLKESRDIAGVNRKLSEILEKQGDHTLLEERLAETARRKRPSPAQVRLAREFDRDIVRFERAFKVDVLKKFEKLGIEIEQVSLEVLEPEPGKSVGFRDLNGLRFNNYAAIKLSGSWLINQSINILANYTTKEAQQDAMDAALITEQLNIAGFETSLAVVYEEHYKRILRATESRVNAVMDLGISIPEPLEAQILAAGRERVGLLDMSRGTKKRVFEQLSQGRANGEAVAQLARRLREMVPPGRFNGGLTALEKRLAKLGKVPTINQIKAAGKRARRMRAQLIARTETGNAQKVAAAASYREGGVTEVLIMDARQGPTDDVCESLNGIVVSLAEGEALMADEHPNGTRRMVAQPPPIEEGI